MATFFFPVVSHLNAQNVPGCKSYKSSESEVNGLLKSAGHT